MSLFLKKYSTPQYLAHRVGTQQIELNKRAWLVGKPNFRNRNVIKEKLFFDFQIYFLIVGIQPG